MIMIKLSLLYDSMVLKHIEISQKKKRKFANGSVCKQAPQEYKLSPKQGTMAGYYIIQLN